jgi:hypothetical protein
MPTLCATFHKEAGAIWNRMTLARQGTKIIIVTLAKKHEEAKHGVDWEWWLVRGRKGLGFRVQAKALVPNGRYLRKPGPNPYEQLDKLVSGSTKEGLVPLYCFFNFSAKQSQFSGSKNSCGHAYHRPSFWGCSLALPGSVKKVQSHQLTNLKSVMSPWHLFVCESENIDLVRAARMFLRTVGMRDEQITPRVLPPRVTR